MGDYLADLTDCLHTVRDYLRFAVSSFNQAGLHFGHGSDNAYDEAVYLILHTLHLPLHQLEPFLDAQLIERERTEVLRMIQQRIEKRLPAAYLTREAWLGDFRFYVDRRVIVPRSFIAELLFDGLEPWLDNAPPARHVLDLCTGSGCLAVIAAHIFESATVDAVDLSSDALAVARKNVTDYGLQNRVELLQSDLFDALQGRCYDLIISNPPYVNQESVEALPPEYQHEPALALGSGQDGLDAVRRILNQARSFLSADGILIVEIGHNRQVLEAAFPELPFIWLPVSAGDQFVFMLHRDDLPD